MDPGLSTRNPVVPAALREGATRRLSLARARRVAISAQGLAGAPAQARPSGAATMRHVQGVIDRIGLLQIDSVNVLARAHLLPLQARLGSYDPALLERATRGTAARPRRLVECWAHEASLVPPSTYRLLRWRMAQPRRQQRLARLRAQHPHLFEWVLALITERGPLTGAQVHAELGHERPPKEHWGWNWTVAKQLLEAAFGAGELAVAHRTAQFERAYDLPRRVLPEEVWASGLPSEQEAVAGLVEIASRAHGIGSITCLADYFRLPVAATRMAAEHLVCTGVLERVEVSEWPVPLYKHSEVPVPRAVHGRALLAPFDPLVFERRRLEALFGMHYRIEIYTPAHRRTYGYYVLPFLLGQDIVGRVDLKADRGRSRLLVRGAFTEPHPPEPRASKPHAPETTARELAAELHVMAGWLGLEKITIVDGAAGDLPARLAPHL